MNMTRSVLPSMRSRKSGTVMFMGSIAAWYGAAAGGLYASTKCALEGESALDAFGLAITNAGTKKEHNRRCRITVKGSV